VHHVTGESESGGEAQDLTAFAGEESFGNLTTERSTAAAMISEHARMWWRFSLAGLVLSFALGCSTKKNPLRCADGICADPAYPFCDTEGEVAGEPDQCIAVACTPGEVDACRGDQAVTCNAEGTDYDIVQCDLGCDVNIGGCRLCEPNETACTNGTVATCDANGAVTSSEECALGCFEDEARCREIDPSNGLGQYLDMVSDPPDLDLQDAYFNTTTGEVRDGTVIVDVPNFYVPGPADGTSIRVFVAGSVKLGKVYAGNKAVMQTDANPTGPAFALVARGDISVSGAFVAPSSGGGMISPGCTGGVLERNDFGSAVASGGGGGGGHGTAGGAGGRASSAAGGVGGLVAGTGNLIPLRGGCAGGSDTDFVGTGGGAIQLTSRTSILIEGVLDVRGANGVPAPDDTQTVQHTMLWGAGAGGGILLEAPTIELAGAAQLVARGGAGEGCTPPTAGCGLPGLGATSTQPATNGGDVENTGSGSFTGGSGGGGLGRIRINTKDQTYSKANTTLEDGLLTVGTTRTR
jgi:hypothetical protein